MTLWVVDALVLFTVLSHRTGLRLPELQVITAFAQTGCIVLNIEPHVLPIYQLQSLQSLQVM